jgi:hypothetical protein
VGDNNITSTVPPNQSGNTVCWSDLSGGLYNTTTLSIMCNNPSGILGRFVSIQQVLEANVTLPLTLCEVLVFSPLLPPPPAGLIDVSTGKPASQSSTLLGSQAGKAVDGIRQIDGAACAHTQVENAPWW